MRILEQILYIYKAQKAYVLIKTSFVEDKASGKIFFTEFVRKDIPKVGATQQNNAVVTILLVSYCLEGMETAKNTVMASKDKKKMTS